MHSYLVQESRAIMKKKTKPTTTRDQLHTTLSAVEDLNVALEHV